MIRLLAAIIALVTGPQTPSPSKESAPSPAQCSAAMAAYYDQTGEFDGPTTSVRELWTALAFHQKDGVLLMAAEAARLVNEVAETRRVLDACGAADPMKRLPTFLPPPSGDPKACEEAQTSATDALKQTTETSTRGEICAALDRSIEISRGIMSDLEAGRLSCADSRYTWIMVGDRGMISETVAIGRGCRNGSVTPNMAMTSPAPRS